MMPPNRMAYAGGVDVWEEDFVDEMSLRQVFASCCLTGITKNEDSMWSINDSIMRETCLPVDANGGRRLGRE